MLLAFDIGNTNIHLGLWDGGGWRLSWRARTVTGKTADEYAVLVRNFLAVAQVELGAISAACMSCVVPALTPTFQELARRDLQLEPLFVSSHIELGIDIAIDSPEQAGADRLCNAVALAQLHGAPAVSVDFGTSTNFDVLSGGRAYIGGVIAPGIRLAHDALVSRAAQLHKVDLLPPPEPIGTNTVHAMQSGIFWGYVGMIDALLSRILTQLNAPSAHVVATGGLAKLFMQHIPRINTIAPELTLDGLRLLYGLNRG
ncbi:MAG: type III pantothenate kinase [Chloroflexi bacterium]|nr:type III pantothenate kinase [Chloroflexota bacterium]MCY3581355.1 type III pantothenate kinase [Chloroflexota bacterium]MCY3716392.1 type III pantothenate kinase [Chloroflexota bacterium]MDE2649408.1 type III pantothenate kinase [Chloroflexota bacterium]